LVLASIFAIAASNAPAPGAPAPPFSGALLDGGSLNLESLRGHVVLINFWAPACPPCRIEMPALERIHRRYSRKGLRVVGITEMDPARAQVFHSIEETGVTYPIILDPGARIGALYAIEAHPTSFVVDTRGIVRYVNVGYLKGEEKEIERAIREALGIRGGS
jgi:peroxiredoxin